MSEQSTTTAARHHDLDDQANGYVRDFRSFVDTIAQRELLTAGQEVRLSAKASGADPRAAAAADEMVRANLLLVVSVSRRYQGQGLSQEELVQEGVEGLMRAVEKFDPARGYKFSTYATYWIAQAIGRAVAHKGRTIRLPEHLGQRLGRLAKAEAAAAESLGREPTAGEVAEACEEFSEEDVDRLRATRTTPSSLDAGIEPDENGSSERGAGLMEVVADHSLSGEAEEAAAFSEECDHLRSALSELPARQRRIVARRYGLEGNEASTFAEISEEMGVSQQRVSSLHYQALQTIRQSLSGLVPDTRKER